MYDLKSQFDVSRFCGATLEQVCFAKFGLHLSFSLNQTDSIKLQIEEVTQKLHFRRYLSPNGLQAEPALMLIEALQLKVVSTNIENVNDFVLTFENGFKILVEALDIYESYHITADGKTVTI